MSEFELSPVEASLEDFAEYLATLTIEEFQACVDGLRAYETAIQAEQFRLDGYIKYED